MTITSLIIFASIVTLVAHVGATVIDLYEKAEKEGREIHQILR